MQLSFAGCGESDTTCSVYEGGEVTSMSCHIVVCANVTSYFNEWELEDGSGVYIDITEDKSDINVDGKPGLSIPIQILKENLTCYGDKEMGKVFCAHNVLL